MLANIFLEIHSISFISLKLDWRSIFTRTHERIFIVSRTPLSLYLFAVRVRYFYSTIHIHNEMHSMTSSLYLFWFVLHRRQQITSNIYMKRRSTKNQIEQSKGTRNKSEHNDGRNEMCIRIDFDRMNCQESTKRKQNCCCFFCCKYTSFAVSFTIFLSVNIGHSCAR